MEAFFKTHKYLVEHLYSPVRRGLMDEINWEDRLIGVKGSRGVGKTTFLLDYAREYFGADNKECLYINLNHFYFTERTLVDFAAEFRAKGGKVLLIDQVFKYSNWSRELRYCYDNFEDLKIVFSGSSVMRLKEENPDLSGKVVSYNLRGFSFREFLNLMSGNQFPAYTFDEVLENHQEIAKRICSVVRPMAYFQDYLHHGFYPFFLEKRNFSENLLKTMIMNAMISRFGLSPDDAKHVAHLSSGSFIKAMEAISLGEENKFFLEQFKAMMRNSWARNVKGMKAMADVMAGIGRERQKNFLSYCQHLIRENFMYRFQSPELNYMNLDEASFSVKFSPFVNERNVIDLMEELAKAERHITQNVNAKMVFFDLSLRITVLIKR